MKILIVADLIGYYKISNLLQQMLHFPSFPNDLDSTFSNHSSKLPILDIKQKIQKTTNRNFPHQRDKAKMTGKKLKGPLLSATLPS